MYFFILGTNFPDENPLFMSWYWNIQEMEIHENIHDTDI